MVHAMDATRRSVQQQQQQQQEQERRPMPAPWPEVPVRQVFGSGTLPETSCAPRHERLRRMAAVPSAAVVGDTLVRVGVVETSFANLHGSPPP